MVSFTYKNCGCCEKISLRTQIKILCAIDLVFLIASTYYTVGVLVNVLALRDDTYMKARTMADSDIIPVSTSQSPTTNNGIADTVFQIPILITVALMSSSLQIFLHAMQIILILVLLYGVQKDALLCCKIWFKSTIALTIVITVMLIVNFTGTFL